MVNNQILKNYTQNGKNILFNQNLSLKSKGFVYEYDLLDEAE